MRVICTNYNHLTVKINVSLAHINAKIFFSIWKLIQTFPYRHKPIISKNYSLIPISISKDMTMRGGTGI